MPITLPFPLRNLTQAEFDVLDPIVMRCAYESQNELGRFCDERVYENDLAMRLRAIGMSDVHTQVPVTVTHQNFKKVYRFDLVVGHGLYELKTVSAFLSQHETQVLNYAMLAALNHVKLINFRGARVQGRLVFNALMPEARRNLIWNAVAWRPVSDHCERLRERLAILLADWGGFLEARLYEEALVHFFGGETVCVKRVPVQRDGVELGSHLINSHADTLSFVVTAFNDPGRQQAHIRRLRRFTNQTAIQWINLSRRAIYLETVTD